MNTKILNAILKHRDLEYVEKLQKIAKKEFYEAYQTLSGDEMLKFGELTGYIETNGDE